MEEKKWRFGVVGNIVSEHTDEDGNVYYGAKAFTPGIFLLFPSGKSVCASCSCVKEYNT